MSRFTASMPPEYFEALYRSEFDPWGFADSPYEQAKYAATLEALPATRYRHALEIGCSIGVLSRLLGERCERLTAIDASSTAVAAARARCHDLEHVDCATMSVPGDFPEGRFDLLVLSEVLYYLDGEDLARLAERCLAVLQPLGDIILVHWTGATNYPLSGDAATERFMAAMQPIVQVRLLERRPHYRLDVARRVHPAP